MHIKTIITRKIPYALLLALVGQLPEIQAQVLPLDSVLATIRQQNPMLGQYDYRARAKDAYAQGAGSWMAPQAGAGLWMAPYDKRMADEMSNGQDLGSVMLSVEQMIPNPPSSGPSGNTCGRSRRWSEATSRPSSTGSGRRRRDSITTG
jgi:hypothetical protein